MANSTKGDTSMLFSGLRALALIVLITGLLIHSFIIGINVNDWWKRSVTSIDHIITFLGISRISTQCVLTLYLLLTTFFQSRLDSIVFMVILARVYAFFTYTNIWLTTLLSIVFCLKISNLRTRLFLYLRRMILPRTGRFIVASGLLSAFSSLIHMLMSHAEVANDGTMDGWNNSTMDCIDINYIYGFSIGASISMILYYISSILLFASLYHHTVKMKMSSNVSINLETYYSTMKFVSLTFMYCTIYFIVHFVCVFYLYFFCVYPKWVYIALDFLPTLHSSYLIYRTSKLRSQMSKVLENVSDFFFQSRDTENSENIVAP